MSQFIVQCLNPYRKPDCKVGRITTTEDFKHLARKVTRLGLRRGFWDEGRKGNWGCLSRGSFNKGAGEGSERGAAAAASP